MIVVDASALVAIMFREPGFEALVAAIDETPHSDDHRKISSLSIWEAACAIGRIQKISQPAALREIQHFLQVARIASAPAADEITQLAIEAAEIMGLETCRAISRS